MSDETNYGLAALQALMESMAHNDISHFTAYEAALFHSAHDAIQEIIRGRLSIPNGDDGYLSYQNQVVADNTGQWSCPMGFAVRHGTGSHRLCRS